MGFQFISASLESDSLLAESSDDGAGVPSVWAFDSTEPAQRFFTLNRLRAAFERLPAVSVATASSR